jgi:hypothetical protein
MKFLTKSKKIQEKFVFFEGVNRELYLLNIRRCDDNHLNHILSYRSEVPLSRSHIKTKISSK